MTISDLDENSFERFLDTCGQSDPDFIIRTAGEQRISNFLLWQAAYSEFYYTDLTWPNFTPNDLKSAIFELTSRSRTFGKNKVVK